MDSSVQSRDDLLVRIPFIIVMIRRHLRNGDEVLREGSHVLGGKKRVQLLA
jgi:hypothetical protein